jgi:hypothetical protein
MGRFMVRLFRAILRSAKWGIITEDIGTLGCVLTANLVAMKYTIRSTKLWTLHYIFSILYSSLPVLPRTVIFAHREQECIPTHVELVERIRQSQNESM